VTNKAVSAQFVRIFGLAEHTLVKKVENKIEGGGYPIPGILQSVRNSLISKELEETVPSKYEASVRNRLI
jgi:hypothetical protein